VAEGAGVSVGVDEGAVVAEIEAPMVNCAEAESP